MKDGERDRVELDPSAMGDSMMGSLLVASQVR